MYAPREMQSFHHRNLFRYLRRVCGGLPPLGSAEREALRGQNKSLKDYILLLSRNGEAMEDR